MPPRATDVLEPGTKVTDKVTLVRLLGEGAMGEVWVAQHETLQTEVAVKFVAPHMSRSRSDALHRFSREARAAAQIKSPHVVQMLDHGVMKGGTPYIVMELLEGESLHDRIDRLGALSIEDTGEILVQVARALGAAHKLGVIHRDIKPHNIFLVAAHGEAIFVKVLDYGVAKQTKRKDASELTEPGTIVGTPQYVSRDLIMGGNHRQIDERVDLWSLAVVTYKCLTATLPFDGDSIATICTALAAGEFAAPSTLRSELGIRYDRWFQRALHPDRQERFATADELAASFLALADRPSSFRSETSDASASTSPRRSRRTAALVMGGALALGGGGLVLRYSADTPVESDAAPVTEASAPESASPGPVNPASVAPSQVASAPSATASTSPTPPEPQPHEVAIAGGKVWMGCAEAGDLDCDDDELPPHEVSVSAFYIGRHEVRVIDYAECVVAGHCSSRRLDGHALDKEKFVRSSRCNWGQPHRERHPMNCVAYADASGYCEWKGARLPTEAEWERAARGDDRRQFPWGDQAPSCAFAVMTEEGDEGCGRRTSWSVGSKAKDTSPFGVRDLSGNVREWIADWYDPVYYATAPARDPVGPAGGARRVARGGSFGTSLSHLMRISNRQSYTEGSRSIQVGFRCARTAAKP